MRSFWFRSLFLGSLACAPAEDPAPGYPFERFEGTDPLPDVQVARLCEEAADPDAAEDVIRIHCRVEGQNVQTAPAPVDSLRVLAWNLERGGRHEQIFAWFGEEAPALDVVFLSEVDRGCARTDDLHIAAELASLLGMGFVYATEFMEVKGTGEEVTEVCEHGNAILSRFPLGNVQAVRHTENVSWYRPPEERGTSWGTRLGGRVALFADVEVGDAYVHLSSLHLASGTLDQDVRAAQAEEVVAIQEDMPFTVISGGDLNAGTYIVDLAAGTTYNGVTQAFLTAAYQDTHQEIPFEERITVDPSLVLDVLFVRDGESAEPGICSECWAWSDHKAIWAEVFHVEQ